MIRNIRLGSALGLVLAAVAVSLLLFNRDPTGHRVTSELDGAAAKRCFTAEELDTYFCGPLSRAERASRVCEFLSSEDTREPGAAKKLVASYSPPLGARGNDFELPQDREKQEAFEQRLGQKGQLIKAFDFLMFKVAPSRNPWKLLMSAFDEPTALKLVSAFDALANSR